LYVVLHRIRPELMAIGPESLNVLIAFSLGAIHLKENSKANDTGCSLLTPRPIRNHTASISGNNAQTHDEQPLAEAM
jgi:hypothetical protein